MAEQTGGRPRCTSSRSAGHMEESRSAQLIEFNTNLISEDVGSAVAGACMSLGADPPVLPPFENK